MEEECPICFEQMATRLRVTAPCAHTVCYACFQRLRAPQTCPMCRDDLSHLMPPPPSSLEGELQPGHVLIAELLRSRSLVGSGITVRRHPSLREVVLRERFAEEEAA